MSVDMQAPPFPMTESELFAAIVDQAPDAITVADAQGRVRLWNRRAQRLFGWHAADVVGGSLDVIIPERLRQAHWDAFFRAVRSGATKYDGRAMPTRSLRSDGTKLYVEMSFSLVTDAAGAVVGALAIARDATARPEAERDCARATQGPKSESPRPAPPRPDAPPLRRRS
jgi:PAS domain S-box-containing protein